MANVVAQFFGGLYVPLPFFPPGLRALADWLPFSGMMNAFTAAFAGKLTGPALALSLAHRLKRAGAHS